jgi:hypothetical protein
MGGDDREGGNVEGGRSEVDVAFWGGRNLRDGEVREGSETRCQGDHTGWWAFPVLCAFYVFFSNLLRLVSQRQPRSRGTWHKTAV